METKKTISKTTRSNFITYLMVIVAFVILQVMMSTGNMSSLLKGQLVPICAYIVMAISLNLVVGISGELSLGHAGFMSVGAFSGHRGDGMPHPGDCEQSSLPHYRNGNRRFDGSCSRSNCRRTDFEIKRRLFGDRNFGFRRDHQKCRQ